MAPVLSILATGLMAINGALAHPGHSVQQEAAERGQWLRARQPNSVRSCAGDLQRRGHLEAALTRRQEMAKNARVKRSLPSKRFERRDFAEYNISHASDLDVTLGSDELLLFSDNSSCVLQPEVTQGPYFVDGELIRQDVTGDQAGVPLYLDIQLIDTSTCEPVPAVFIDIWHCNATGVYSGVSAAGNGNEDDVSNIQNTFLRGIQQTDANGVAQFETIVPGHYTSRAPHIHVLSHNTNDTIVRTNGTLLEGYGNFSVHASHVGQLFMDQDLLARVSETAPYNTNTQELTLNSDDQILSAETETMDPFIQYVLVGDDIEDGIMAWISLGIDPTADTEVTSVGTHYEDGGVVNTESSMGGGGDAPGGNSTGDAPSGSMPSGSAPTAAAASSASAY